MKTNNKIKMVRMAVFLNTVLTAGVMGAQAASQTQAQAQAGYFKSISLDANRHQKGHRDVFIQTASLGDQGVVTFGLIADPDKNKASLYKIEELSNSTT